MVPAMVRGSEKAKGLQIAHKNQLGFMHKEGLSSFEKAAPRRDTVRESRVHSEREQGTQ